MRVVLALFLCLCLLPMTARAATAAPPTLITWETGWDSSGVAASRVPTEGSAVPLPLFVRMQVGGAASNESKFITAGDEITTEELHGASGNLTWACDPTKRYALFLVDNEGMPEGFEWINHLVYNIEKCNVSMGHQAFEYLPPFVYDLENDTSAVVSDGSVTYTKETVPKKYVAGADRKVPFLYMMYEQGSSSRIDMGLMGKACASDVIGGSRKVNMTELRSKHDLIGPVAANVARVPVNTNGTTKMLCFVSK